MAKPSRAADDLSEGGTSDRVIDSVAGRYAIVLRCGAVVVASAAGWIGPPDGVSYTFLTIAIVILDVWAVLFTWAVRRHGLSGGLAVADAGILLAVLLAQRRLVSAALVSDGTSWTLMLASTAVFIPQLILRPLAGAAITIVVAAGFGLAEPVWTTGPAFLLLQGAVTCALMSLVRRGGRSADAVIARGERAMREEQVRSARRADEREQYRRLHDTILATHTVVASGVISRASVALRLQAASDLETLAELPGLPARGITRAVCGSADLGEILASVASHHGAEIVISAADRGVPVMVADAIADSVAEALVNVARHAGTTAAAVQLRDSRSGVIVTISDQGRGFVPARISPAKRGIRESIAGRMASAGGAAEVDSSPGRGTRVTLRWPA